MEYNLLMKSQCVDVRTCTLQGPTNVEAICRLVELGAKVAAVTEESMLESPLHIAARCGRQDIVKRLLACNVPILSQTKVPSALRIPCKACCVSAGPARRQLCRHRSACNSIQHGHSECG